MSGKRIKRIQRAIGFLEGERSAIGWKQRVKKAKKLWKRLNHIERRKAFKP